jgi:hypothetical protein
MKCSEKTLFVSDVLPSGKSKRAVRSLSGQGEL